MASVLKLSQCDPPEFGVTTQKHPVSGAYSDVWFDRVVLTNASDEKDSYVWYGGYHIDHVTWTALLPRFFSDEKPKERNPTSEQVIQHLLARPECEEDPAEKYVRRAPRQINTEYRRRIEAALGWSPCGGESDST